MHKCIKYTIMKKYNTHLQESLLIASDAICMCSKKVKSFSNHSRCFTVTINRPTIMPFILDRILILP